jgi:D-alanyl-D-alanine carboxypeptidase/D-alanyl-D-alanine-endopeptidase (penicillin-binding protein 4)
VLVAAVLAGAKTAEKKVPPLRQRVDAILQSSPAAQRAFWGINVVQVSTGKPLLALNPRRTFTPASNTKLFTSALALMELGPSFQFETTVTAERAPDASGRITGDLRLMGGGDPLLSGRPVPYQKGAPNGNPLQAIEALADQVVAQGVKRIDGDIVGDDTAYVWEPYPEGWAQDDMVWDYGAPVSALSVNDNTIVLRVRAAASRASITLNPPLEYYAIDNRVRVGPGLENRVFVDRLPGSRQVRLWGTLNSNPPGATAVLLAIDDPALYAAHALADALACRGVQIGGRPRALHRYPNQPVPAGNGVVLAHRVSPPLIELLRITNKVSQNLYAELVLRAVARARRSAGTRALGLDELRQFLSGLGITEDEYHFVDGSGLSPANLVAPETVTKLLLFMQRSPYRDAWVSLLPVGGNDGTLSNRFAGKRAARRIFAKTGTETHISALSGYAESRGRGLVAFSILVNNYDAPAAEIRSLIDRLALALTE